MISISSTPSCGLYYLGGETQYKTAEVYFKDFATQCFGTDKPKMVDGRNINTFCLFVWTHPPQTYSIGGLMKAYIEKHELGVVVESPKGKNPLHKEHDGAVVWTWVRNNENFTRHCKELLCTSKAPQTAEPSSSTVSVNSIQGLPHASLQACEMPAITIPPDVVGTFPVASYSPMPAEPKQAVRQKAIS